MKFRVTILVVCAMLLYLGYTKISFLLRNPEPEVIALEKSQDISKAAREWVTITGGTLLLKEAISSNGEVELEALLVPLVLNKLETKFRIMIETRDPQLLRAYSTYYLGMETEAEKEKYFNDNIEVFESTKSIVGVIKTGSEADYNRKKLFELAEITNTNIAEDVTYILATDDEPDKYGGFFYIIIALFGLMKVAYFWQRGKASVLPNNESNEGESDVTDDSKD